VERFLEPVLREVALADEDLADAHQRFPSSTAAPASRRSESSCDLGAREGKSSTLCCKRSMKAGVHPLAGLLCVSACAHSLTSEQEAMVRRGDCAELLRAADAARAQERGGLASTLANACQQKQLDALVASAPDPAQGMLWCGRARS